MAAYAGHIRCWIGRAATLLPRLFICCYVGVMASVAYSFFTKFNFWVFNRSCVKCRC